MQFRFFANPSVACLGFRWGWRWWFTSGTCNSASPSENANCDKDYENNYDPRQPQRHFPSHLADLLRWRLVTFCFNKGEGLSKCPSPRYTSILPAPSPSSRCPTARCVRWVATGSNGSLVADVHLTSAKCWNPSSTVKRRMLLPFGMSVSKDKVQAFHVVCS